MEPYTFGIFVSLLIFVFLVFLIYKVNLNELNIQELGGLYIACNRSIQADKDIFAKMLYNDGKMDYHVLNIQIFLQSNKDSSFWSYVYQYRRV